MKGYARQNMTSALSLRLTGRTQSYVLFDEIKLSDV